MVDFDWYFVVGEDGDVVEFFLVVLDCLVVDCFEIFGWEVFVGGFDFL